MPAKTAKKDAEPTIGMMIKFAPIADLTPYPNNAKIHGPQQVSDLEAAIQEFGFTQPALYDGGGLIAGHRRRLAMISLHKKGVPVYTADGTLIPPGTMPAISVDGLSDERRRTLILWDNRSAEQSPWDNEVLKLELSALEALDPKLLGMAGFTDADFAKLLAVDQPALEPQQLWAGMPEFEQKDVTGFRTVVLHFKDQAAVEEFEKLLGRKLAEKARYLWFPEQEVETYADKKYVAQG